MSRRVLTFGAIAAVLLAAVLVNLSVLDVLSTAELKETLGRSLLVLGISTLALVLTITIVKMGRHAEEQKQPSKK
ncbi:MAG TPA: hypothetical protein VM818_16995 [Vicinamibacterales bacterium]|nr:hypothetical protein [Vicinamibacterales bacterium]